MKEKCWIICCLETDFLFLVKCQMLTLSSGWKGCPRMRTLGARGLWYPHSKPKNVFLHIFCVRMCAKCVIKCLFGTHGVTNVFHYRKISVTSKKKCYKNVPLTLWIAYSHIPNSMCFICVKKKSLKLFRCHIYLLILTHREWNVL